MVCIAEIAQLGERQTEDLKVPGSIPGFGIKFYIFFRKIMPFFLLIKPEFIGRDKFHS